MSSLKADFDEMLERIRQGRDLGHASFEPIYYLVFPPRQILEVKRQHCPPGRPSCATTAGRSTVSRLPGTIADILAPTPLCARSG